MTTYVEARDALVDFINTDLTASYPTVPVFYENTVQVDLNTVGDQFLRVSIDFITAKQATIEFSPQQRVLGELTFQMLCKEGSGTRTTLAFYDHVFGTLANRMIGGVTLRTPVPGKKEIKSGWASFTLAVPFTFDSTS